MSITLTMNEVDTLVAAGPTACYEYLLKYQGPQYPPETARRRDAVAEWAGVAPDSVDIFLCDGRECFRVGEIDVRVMTEAEADSALGDIRTFQEYQSNLHSKVDYVFIAGFLDSEECVSLCILHDTVGELRLRRNRVCKSPRARVRKGSCAVLGQHRG